MKVFLGWSGKRSYETAQAFYEWLPKVIQAIEPFISSGLPKGKHWGVEITKELEETKFGILCLTRENLHEDWILYEAGALSKTKDAHVCTFLLDLNHTDIEAPLASFQHTTFEKNDIRNLMDTINEALEKLSGDHLLKKDILDDTFDLRWPELEKNLNKILEDRKEEYKPIREERDILEEILTLLRAETAETMPSIAQQMPTYMIGEQKMPGTTGRKGRGSKAEGTPAHRD